MREESLSESRSPLLLTANVTATGFCVNWNFIYDRAIGVEFHETQEISIDGHLQAKTLSPHDAHQ
jgi:hypothetical protein